MKNLKETIEKMRKEKNFPVLFEAMKRRADRGLIEGITTKDIEDALAEIETRERNYNMSYTKTMYELSEAIEKYGNLTEDSTPAELNEAVTFIDNAGNLKTMKTEDYVKDQHEYNTKTSIEPYDKKKRKIIDYKLISESDLNEFLTMSLDEILNEATKEAQ